jgi:hypothetical protein
MITATAGEIGRLIPFTPLEPHFVPTGTIRGADKLGTRVIRPIGFAIGALQPLGMPIHKDGIKPLHMPQVHPPPQQPPERIVASNEVGETKGMTVGKPIMVTPRAP